MSGDIMGGSKEILTFYNFQCMACSKMETCSEKSGYLDIKVQGKGLAKRVSYTLTL